MTLAKPIFVLAVIASLAFAACTATNFSSTPAPPGKDNPTPPIDVQGISGNFEQTRLDDKAVDYTILEDTSAGFFIATTSSSFAIGGGGIRRYDDATNTFVQTNNKGGNFADISETSDGIFATLVCSYGIIKWDSPTSTWKVSKKNSVTFATDWLRGVAGTSQGTFAYGNSVFKYNPKDGTWVTTNAHMRVYNLVETTGGIFIGAEDNTGIKKFNAISGTWDKTNWDVDFVGDIKETKSGIFANVRGNTGHGVRKWNGSTWETSNSNFNYFTDNLIENSLGIFAKVSGQNAGDIWKFDTTDSSWKQSDPSLFRAIQTRVTKDVYRPANGIQRLAADGTTWKSTALVGDGWDMYTTIDGSFAVNKYSGEVFQLDTDNEFRSIFKPGKSATIIGTRFGTFLKSERNWYRYKKI